MSPALQSAWLSEVAAVRVAISRRETETAFLHLERAHILSQRFTRRHVYVHWLMLKLGLSVGDWREVIGQISRMVAACLFSRIWIPVGNTGRATVSAFRPMAIPEDLRSILEQCN